MSLVTPQEKAAIRETVMRIFLSGITRPKDISLLLRSEFGSRCTSERTVERLLRDLRSNGEIEKLPVIARPAWKMVDQRIISTIRATWRKVSDPRMVAQEIKRLYPDLDPSPRQIRDLQLEMLRNGVLPDPADDERFRLTPRPTKSKKPRPREPALIALSKLDDKDRRLRQMISERKRMQEFEKEQECQIAEEQRKQFDRSVIMVSPQKAKEKRKSHRRRLKK